MKQSVCALILFVAGVVHAQYSLFDDTYLHEIRITSTDPNFWQTMQSDWQNNFDTGVDIPYQSTTVVIDGNELLEVGVRQKGFSSNFFATTNKKPLKLHFSKFVDGREYDGVRKLNLANGVGDPAIIKDKLAYDMFRYHGIPGPRVAHAKIYINDTYWGVYAMIEQIDKRYLKRNFADNDGNLWKNKGNSNLSWKGSEPTSYPFELQTNEVENDWSKFIGFVDFINNSTNVAFEEDFTDIFHVDEYLKIIAIDILINNWDSYLDHGRNWYLYHEPKSDKIHWIPWDYNFAFDREEWGASDLVLIQNDPSKVLTKRIFDNSTYRLRVLNYLCEVLTYNFTDDRLYPMMDAQLDLLENEWSASNNLFSFQDVTDYIDGQIWSGSPIGNNPFQSLKKFLTDRKTVIQNELNQQNHTCPLIDSAVAVGDLVINEFVADNEGEWLDQDGDDDDWIELHNTSSQDISLENYFLSDTSTFIHKWELPDVMIPAGGYLIIWADKDIDQVGLHTQFSLSKSGGEVILSHLDGSILDSITYAEQSENISMARIPNGTGPFVSTSGVTFGAANDSDLIFSAGFDQ